MPMCKTLVSALLGALYAILLASSLEGGGVMRNLAIRGAMMGASGGVPTARDYVQDGLIVLYDAIENSGWGVHLNNVSSWINLAGNAMSEMMLSGEYEIQQNCVRLNWSAVNSRSSNGIGYATASLPSGKRNFECCVSDCKANFVSESNRLAQWITGPKEMPSFELSSSNKLIFGGQQFNVYSPSVDNVIEYREDRHPGCRIMETGMFTFGTFTTDNLNEIIFFNNAKIFNRDTSQMKIAMGCVDEFRGNVEFFNRSSDFMRPMNAKVHCIRVYSRPLTPSEIAANYDIDKARFGIT